MTMYSALRHVPSIFRKRRPIQLTLFLTRKCNARCPWCFYLKSRTPAAAGAPLSLREIERISKSLGRLLWVAFSGGEVFLREDLVEISGLFHDRNRPRVLLLPTNGLMPESITEQTHRILKRCPKSIVVVKVSLDGLDDDHDALRGSPGAFAKALETYRSVARLRDRFANLELGINSVFLSENEDRMDEVIDFVAGLDSRGTHTVSLVRGDLADARYLSVDPAKYRRTADRMRRDLKVGTARIHRFAGARFKAAQDILQRRLIHRTLVEQRRLIPCYAGILSVVLSETGELHACESLADSLGNVRAHDYDVGRLLGSDRAQAILGRIADGACHCTHECNFIMNIMFNPALYPALASEYLGLAGARSGPVAAPTGGDETAPCCATAKTDSASR